MADSGPWKLRLENKFGSDEAVIEVGLSKAHQRADQRAQQRVDSRSNGYAYNKNPSNNIFIYSYRTFSFIIVKWL